MKQFKHPETGETIVVNHENVESIFEREGFIEIPMEDESQEDEEKKQPRKKTASE